MAIVLCIEAVASSEVSTPIALQYDGASAGIAAKVHDQLAEVESQPERSKTKLPVELKLSINRHGQLLQRIRVSHEVCARSLSGDLSR